METRAGRGRLSGIELLPEECSPIIAWAAEQLRDRNRTQTEIYEEFVGKLTQMQAEHRGELEFTIPSFSAFNRHSIKLATVSRRLDQTREIASTLAEKFDPDSSDKLTVIAAEAIKTLVFEVLTTAGEAGIDPKGAMELARALAAASQAQTVSSNRRRQLAKEVDEKLEKASAAIEKVTGKTGMSKDIVKRFRTELGIDKEV